MNKLIQLINTNLAKENISINIKSADSGERVDLSNIKIELGSKTEIAYSYNDKVYTSVYNFGYSASAFHDKLAKAINNAGRDYLKGLRDLSSVWRHESAYFFFYGDDMSYNNIIDLNPAKVDPLSNYQRLGNIARVYYVSYGVDNDANYIDRFVRLAKFNDFTKVDVTYDLNEYENLNKDLCADKHINTLFMVRNDTYHGHFELSGKEDFERCATSNYLVHGMYRAFNERIRYYGYDKVTNTFNSSGSGVITLSRNSFDKLPTCSICGSRHNGATNTHCDSCSSKIKKVLDVAGPIDFVAGKCKILDYHTRPSAKFLNDEKDVKPLYLGVEVEVDLAGQDSEDEDGNDEDSDISVDLSADLVLQKISPMGYVYAKHDGSLQKGFEIISHPVTLEKHAELDWEGGMKALTSLGFNSHNTETCGLHVHINRNFFGQSATTQLIHGAKIAYLMEKHWGDFVKFTRRKVDKLDRWSALRRMFPTTEKISDRQGTNAQKSAFLKSQFTSQYNYRNKYVALNTMHSNTFEFRIFRGTINHTTFKATLQFVDNLARLVKKTKVDKLDTITFKDIINFRRHNELNHYYAHRFATNTMVRG
jgi:hypothetical protein